MDIFLFLGFAFGGLVLLFLIVAGMGGKGEREDSDDWIARGDYED